MSKSKTAGQEGERSGAMTLGAVHASRQGAAHLKDGTPNQDSVVVAMPFLGRLGSTAVMAVSDGAGSARYSQHGSRAACIAWRRQPDPPAQSQPRHSRQGAPDAQRSAARRA